MYLQRKIDKANSLLDVIEEKQGLSKLQDLSKEDLVYMVRCYEIFTDMTIDLIIAGAWN